MRENDYQKENSSKKFSEQMMQNYTLGNSQLQYFCLWASSPVSSTAFSAGSKQLVLAGYHSPQIPHHRHRQSLFLHSLYYLMRLA